MAESPKVSIIIPCYNREDYIKETIESVLNQTYINVETIVVDDGCSDRSREIMEKYKNVIQILEHPGRVNKGQSAAINLGIRHSQGEYIAILDSDDLFAPEKIEMQVKFLEKYPEVGLVYSNGYGIDEKGKILYKFYEESHYENSNPERILMDCYFLVPNNALVRRSVFEMAGGFDESLRAAQDHDMAIRLGEITKLGYLNRFLFYYRRHENSISAKNADLRWKNGFYILKKAAKRYPYSFYAKRKRFAVLNFRLGQCFLENNKYTLATVHFLIAGLSDPIRSIEVLLGKEYVSSPH